MFWNTLGSSAGGFVAGYVFIPLLGLGGTFAILGAVSVAIGLATQWRIRRDAARNPLWGPATVVSLFALVACSGEDEPSRSSSTTEAPATPKIEHVDAAGAAELLVERVVEARVGR